MSIYTTTYRQYPLDVDRIFNPLRRKAFQVTQPEFVMEFVLVSFGHQNEQFFLYGSNDN